MPAFTKDPAVIATLTPIEPANVSASSRFIHRDDMEAEGYGAYLNQVEDRK